MAHAQENIHTYCRICEAHCGLTVDLDDSGSITKIRPDKSHSISQGFVCAKGLKFGTIADHPERLRYPQVRQPDGTRQRVSWDSAMEQTGRRLQEIIQQHGEHALAIYFGTPMIHNGLGLLTTFQWAKSLGTRNIYSAASQDNSNKFAAQHIITGSPYIMPIVDIENADLAVLIGTNPALSQGTFVHMPQGTRAYDDLLKRGGEIIVIDPRESESAKRWGGHIPIMPDTDVYLLLAILDQCRDLYRNDMAKGLDKLLALAANYPPEKVAGFTGISQEQIIDLVQKIRSTDRTTFMLSVGVNQGSFGTLSFIAVQAVAYLTGNFDAEGGLLYNRFVRWLDLLVGLPQQPSRIGNYTSYAGGLPCGILADEILTEGEEKIRALFVIAGNPLTSVANEQKLREAFSSLDLLVSIDIFENQTGQLAHVLFPGATWLERFDLAAWDAMYENTDMLQVAAPVRDLPDECRTERQILSELSWRSGNPVLGSTTFAKVWASWDWDGGLSKLLEPVQWLFRKRLGDSEGVPWLAPKAGTYHGKQHKKLNFWHDDMLGGERQRLLHHEQELQVLTSSDTLILLGRRRRLAQNSWIHNASLEEKPKEQQAWLSSDDMARLGVVAGDTIRITNATGSITIEATQHDSVQQGTIIVPHGLPDVNVNCLIPSDHTAIEPMSGMHKLIGHPVSIKKA